MPWRETTDPYKILVSEIMLQQTQVSRVIPKFTAFLERFPTVDELAAAKLGEVLMLWSGLGYNRRAKYLWQSAKMIKDNHNGKIPKSVKELSSLPGIGKNTAGAVLTYAFNQQSPFIETNIRTVYIHHFFADRTDVADAELLPIVIQTTPRNKPREFNWALMDYGVYLKQSSNMSATKSRHYKKQTQFKGSKRQIRGDVMKLLTQGNRTKVELLDSIQDERLDVVIDDLLEESMILEINGKYSLFQT